AAGVDQVHLADEDFTRRVNRVEAQPADLITWQREVQKLERIRSRPNRKVHRSGFGEGKFVCPIQLCGDPRGRSHFDLDRTGRMRRATLRDYGDEGGDDKERSESREGESTQHAHRGIGIPTTRAVYTAGSLCRSLRGGGKPHAADYGKTYLWSSS